MTNVIYANGIRANTGQYGVKIELDRLYGYVCADKPARVRKLGPPQHIPFDQLSKARWGIIWPPQSPDDPALNDKIEQHRAALKPLIDHRLGQLEGKAVLEFSYEYGWTLQDFFRKYGQDVAAPDHMEPSIIPYYVCLVGPPDRIPWDFQQDLDGEYAVGRIWFDDVEDCTAYVKHLIDYETAQPSPSLGREALFVAPHHPDDEPTEASANRLIKPLYQYVMDNAKIERTLLLGNDQSDHAATKDNLLQRLTAKHPPALLFTASHGVEVDYGDGHQVDDEGALLMQDWPRDWNQLDPKYFLAGRDVQQQGVQLNGLVAFCFACFSGGAPAAEDWIPPHSTELPAKIADTPFVARLPQKLLSHGALGFIGHVSRVWDYSFLGVAGKQPQLNNFYGAVFSLLGGQAIGHATDSLNRRSITLAGELYDELQKPNHSKDHVTQLWMARNDFRGYVIIGDPAARLRLNVLQ